MQWSREERAFAVSVYFSSGRSIVATQRAFRRQFNVAPTGRVPGRTSIVQWVNTFMNTGSVWKQKPGPSKTTRTPENVERVRQAVLQSPKRSARKHASALRISDRTVRRILHQDLPDVFSQLNTKDGGGGDGEDAEDEKKRQKRGGKGMVRLKKKDDTPKKVVVFLSPRGKKKTTVIMGLKTFDLDLKACSKTLGQKFACGCSVTGPDEIVLQGDIKEDVIDFILDKWPQIDDDSIEDGGERKR